MSRASPAPSGRQLPDAVSLASQRRKYTGGLPRPLGPRYETFAQIGADCAVALVVTSHSANVAVCGSTKTTYVVQTECALGRFELGRFELRQNLVQLKERRGISALSVVVLRVLLQVRSQGLDQISHPAGQDSNGQAVLLQGLARPTRFPTSFMPRYADRREDRRDRSQRLKPVSRRTAPRNAGLQSACKHPRQDHERQGCPHRPHSAQHRFAPFDCPKCRAFRSVVERPLSARSASFRCLAPLRSTTGASFIDSRVEIVSNRTPSSLHRQKGLFQLLRSAPRFKNKSFNLRLERVEISQEVMEAPDRQPRDSIFQLVNGKCLQVFDSILKREVGECTLVFGTTGNMPCVGQNEDQSFHRCASARSGRLRGVFESPLASRPGAQVGLILASGDAERSVHCEYTANRLSPSGYAALVEPQKKLVKSSHHRAQPDIGSRPGQGYAVLLQSLAQADRTFRCP